MRTKKLNKMMTISDFEKSNISFPELLKARSELKIAIIDDRGFDADGLRKQGFNSVDVFTEYTTPKDFEHFDVIVTDIDGVGVSLNKQKQGIAVAKTLKDIYPLKIILIFSSFDPKSFDPDYLKYCDGFMEKGWPISERGDYISEKAAVFWDPVLAWKKSERFFREKGIANKVIADIEDDYVQSLTTKSNKIENGGYEAPIELAIAGVSLLVQIITAIQGR